MKNSQLISIRLEVSTLELIDNYCSKRAYLSRSALINQALTAVMKCSDENSLQEIAEVFDPYSAGYHLTFAKKETQTRFIK